MRRWLFVLAWGAGCLGTAGCGWGDRRGEVQEFEALPGLTVCEVEDEVFLHIKRDAEQPGGYFLFTDRLQAEEARLRVGGEFVLSNGNDYAEWYRVLLLQPERIVLKRTEVRTPADEKKGLRRTERVIAVKPYNLEGPG